MANNRNDSERRYFDERGNGPRSERDYDPDRYPYRDKESDHEPEREPRWRGAYRERFSRRTSDGRDLNGVFYDRDFEPSPGASTFAEFETPAWRIPGLRPRGSTTSFGSDYGFDMNHMARTYYGPMNYAGRGPKGYRRSDERIKEDVCDVLERHPAIDASEMEVTVSDGVVFLRGAVENRAQKRLAEDSIENLMGVRDVRNELVINQELFIQARRAHEGVAVPKNHGATGSPNP